MCRVNSLLSRFGLNQKERKGEGKNERKNEACKKGGKIYIRLVIIKP